jgi:hypothetical protein
VGVGGQVWVEHTGPRGGRRCFEQGQLEAVWDELCGIREEADECDGNYLLAWEMEDWVSPGYQCRLYPAKDLLHAAPAMEFSPADLWCVGCAPPVDARLR